MIFAVIGAVRGDAALFSRVIQAIESEGIYTIFHTGNLVIGGEGGPEIAAGLRKRGIEGVQGMEDRLLASLERKRNALMRKMSPESFAELERAGAQIASRDLEWLRGLPKSESHTVDGIEIGLCCGSPSNPREVVGEDLSKERLSRLREEMPSPILICGSAGAFFTTWIGSTLMIAPPPLATGGGAGQYVRVSTEEEPWTAACVVV
ncbi:MAG: metallophosphoesterase family protein [Candidatus Hydrogenedentes bacterium]|nr:metallophosphoesterase family protein [Candidatus Hydrogenedentota bacterium]